MSRLWVPPKVSQELKDGTRRHNAEVLDMFWLNTPVCSEWNRELEQLDPRLRLAQAKPDAHAPGVKPGYYHLLMVNPDQPLTHNPLTGPDGEFVEPSSRMLETLRSADLQNARAVLDRARRQERAERDSERQEERDGEAQQQELVERWRAVSETSVSMNDSQPWSQNVKGRRKTA